MAGFRRRIAATDGLLWVRKQPVLVVLNGSRSEADGVSRARFAAVLHRA